MRETLKKIANNLLYILLGNAVYGVFLYFFVTWLDGYSTLLAYLGNLLLIFLVVAVDEYSIRKMIGPENLYREYSQLKDAQQRESYLRFQRWALTHYMTFKTFLFVFYIAVLIFAQILKFYPSLAGESIANFIGIIEYSVIVLLALKDFGEELSRDRGRAKARLEEFEVYLADHPIPENEGLEAETAKGESTQ